MHVAHNGEEGIRALFRKDFFTMGRNGTMCINRRSSKRIKGAIPKFTGTCLSFLMAFGCAAWAGVSVEPSAVMFNALNETAVVKLLNEGAPIPAKDIKDWRLLTGKSSYNHMITLEKTDGAITLRPAALEAGSYDLAIDTAYGPVHVQVLAPLNNVPNIIEQQAAALGISVEELNKRLGRSMTLPHGAKCSIQLPPSYFEGQALELDMPLEPERIYVWKINGETVKQGPGENKIAYVFTKPGDYTIDYEERDGNAVVTACSAKTTVISMEPVFSKVPVNTQVKYNGPDGFASYVWSVDGEVRAKEKSFPFTFRAVAKYKIECKASHPEKGSADAYFRQEYVVDVLPK